MKNSFKNKLSKNISQYLPPIGDAEAVIFDYDRTIATIPVDWSVARQRLRSWLIGICNLMPPEYDRLDELEKWAVSLGNLPALDVFLFRRETESQTLEAHDPVCAVIDVLHWLREDYPNLPLYIISNNLRSTVTEGLTRLGLSGVFKTVLGIDDTYDPKPSIVGFLRLELLHHLKPQNCLFIGDSEHTDGGLCSQVGMPFINITKE